MGDLTIQWDAATGTGDFVMAGAGLQLGNDLETAVLITLFTDAVADPSDILRPGDTTDPRGWWADTYEGDQIGSKLWQVFARPTTQATLNWVRDQVAKRLQWMIDDGVASAVDVATQWQGKGALGIGIVITEPSGAKTPFSYVWGDTTNQAPPAQTPVPPVRPLVTPLGYFTLGRNGLGKV